jgi:hypothetical protein
MSLDAFTNTLPPDTKAAPLSSNNGYRVIGDRPGLDLDAIITGPTPAERNTTMWTALGAMRGKGYTPASIRTIAEWLGGKWGYDEPEFNKLEDQLRRVQQWEPELREAESTHEQDVDEQVQGWDTFYTKLTTSGQNEFISTGINTLDISLGGGLEPKTRFDFVAWRGVAKTVIKSQILMDAVGRGIPVMYNLIDGSFDLWRRRQIARLTNVALQMVRDHYRNVSVPNADVLARYKLVATQLRDWARSGLLHLTKFHDGAALLRYLDKHPEIQMMAMDQLHDMTAPKGMQPGMHALEENSMTLRDIAHDRGLVVLVANNINRPDSKDRNAVVFKPNDWSIRGSERIPHHADVILNLSRAKGSHRLMVELSKTRDGEDGQEPLTLFFDGMYAAVRVPTTQDQTVLAKELAGGN